ncbi:hypothetical protein [Saccharopolyspora mangrovi]|uniref:DUF1440 domain-containing protein n=1 Tax=Saccharopolyspora mangrovi TaxID=3082379 RepID=A0ABU6AHE6_9PSEU|nr:hypothetical protein [Saccharopolyspora sp. S2-29]MEB3370962.1 hypothetical protein [Saccharopolyspora sp. S2-29]
MSATAHPTHSMPAAVSRVLHGALAGIGGGLAFGILMTMMGMLPMVAMLVGSDSAAVGAVVHLAISALLGAGFGLVVPFTRFWALLGAGVAYGVIWWVLGGLLLMPGGLGMPVLQMSPSAMQSLIGHLIYGIVTALIFYGFRRRANHS